MKKIIFPILFSCIILFGVSGEVWAYNEKSFSQSLPVLISVKNASSSVYNFWSGYRVAKVADGIYKFSNGMQYLGTGLRWLDTLGFQWNSLNRTTNWITILLSHNVEIINGDTLAKAGDNINFSYYSQFSIYDIGGIKAGNVKGILIDDFPDYLSILKNYFAKSDQDNRILSGPESGLLPGYLSSRSDLSPDYFSMINPEEGFLTIFYKKPNTEIVSSDNNIVECLGMNCVAKNAGNARLFFKIQDIQYDRVYFFRPRNLYMVWGMQKHSLIWKGDLVDGKIFWDITVSDPNPPTPPSPPVVIPDYNGDCKASIVSSYSCQAPQGDICEIGTPSNVELDGNNWRWTCVGSGTGTNEACMTLRACPQKEVNP